jgi:hypothetical protein
MTNAVSVAVVDDHPLFREGVIRSLSETGRYRIVANRRDISIRLHQPGDDDCRRASPRFSSARNGSDGWKNSHAGALVHNWC